MAYIEEPCTECGLILPKNELQRRVANVLTGGATGSTTSGTYASGAPRVVFKSGHKTFKTVEELLCPACVERRIAQQQSQRRAAIIKWSIGAFLLVLLIAVGRLAAVSRPDEPTEALMPAAPAAVIPNLRDVVPRRGEAPAEPPLAEDESLPAELQPDDRGAAVQDDAANDVLALRAAIRQALDSGEVTYWGTDRRGGKVIVGPVAVDDERMCRPFIYTVNDARSADIFACREAGGPWIVQQ